MIMTDEQIKRKAKAYAVIETACNSCQQYCERGFIAGAHSRDEEIEELKRIINEQNGIICSLDGKDRVSIIKQRDKLIEENKQLRNPWISVKGHLPEMFVDSEGITHNFSVKVLVTNENNPNYWHVAEYFPDKNEWCCLEHPTYIIDNVTHWMPISKV